MASPDAESDVEWMVPDDLVAVPSDSAFAELVEVDFEPDLELDLVAVVGSEPDVGAVALGIDSGCDGCDDGSSVDDALADCDDATARVEHEELLQPSQILSHPTQHY